MKDPKNIWKNKASDWDKILANQVSDRSLNFGICKEFSKAKVKKIPSIKSAKDMYRHFMK